MYRPNPYVGPTTYPNTPAQPPDPAQTMGNIGLALGIFALAGEFGSVFFLCCCGAFAFLGPCLMAVPAGVGLFLSMKAPGNLRTSGMIVNGIALAIAVVAILGVTIMLLLYGGIFLFSLSQQNQGGGF
jgi:hypothetical protein